MVDCQRQLVQQFSGASTAFHPRYFVEYVPMLYNIMRIQSAEDTVGDVSRGLSTYTNQRGSVLGFLCINTDYLLPY